MPEDMVVLHHNKYLFHLALYPMLQPLALCIINVLQYNQNLVPANNFFYLYLKHYLNLKYFFLYLISVEVHRINCSTEFLRAYFVCPNIFCMISADFGRPAKFQRILHLLLKRVLNDNSSEFYNYLYLQFHINLEYVRNI